ncbi:ParB/RepB/Spo0J family partition protein [Chloroflexota bacterium]
MAKRVGLGKGLDALIPGGDDFYLDKGSRLVDIERINPNPSQPRRKMISIELEDLANSIAEHGILQPLIISPANDSGNFILIAGERRLEAARLAGLEQVPVVIREATDVQRLELALIENIQREDLNPLEEAQAFAQLSDEFSLSHEEIARRVGKNRTTITNRLRLLKLPDAVQGALVEGTITEGHARALLGLSNMEAQVTLLKTIIGRDLNVRQVEELVRKLTGQQKKKKPAARKDPHVSALEDKLQSNLGTKVRMHSGKRGGSVTIFYYSDEELDALLERLLDG